ncbi:hypothetical protein E4U41_001701, partial [Claviceps citrina]
MPRPKRARRAPPVTSTKPSATTNKHDDGDDHDGPRGRTRARARVTRSAAARNSVREEEEALRAAHESRDAALDRLANEDPTVTSGPEDDARGRRISVELGRRVVATPLASRRRRDASGLDLADDSMFGDVGDSFADGPVPEEEAEEEEEEEEVPPHSGGAASSSAATASRRFRTRTRPRSRQSSIIERNDPPIRPSSRGANTPGVSSSFNIGVFRRRAREPSILGRSRRAQSQTGSVAGSLASSRAGSVTRDLGSDVDLDLDLDLDLESEGDGDGEGEGGSEVVPEAESTPSKSRRQSRKSQNRHQQREEIPSSPPLSRPPSREPRRRSLRKRKSDDDAIAQSERARPAKASRVEANGGLVIDSDSDLSDASSPSSSPPAPAAAAAAAAARLARPVTPLHANMDEITAPPASSDPEAENNDIWPDIHTLAKRRRRPSVTTPLRPNGDDLLSDVSTPPSLTHSPNLAAATRGGARGAAAAAKKQRERSPKMTTTADLTSLLPKRSHKRIRDDDDDDESDAGSDGAPNPSDEEDTWSRRPQRSSRRRKTTRRPAASARAATGAHKKG